jgi:hypothetical protein
MAVPHLMTTYKFSVIRMTHRRTMLLSTSHAFVPLVGIVAGVWLAVERVGRANAIFEDIGSRERMNSYVLAQRALGDSAAYESALNEYLSSLERRRSIAEADRGEMVSAEEVLAKLARRHG